MKASVPMGTAAALLGDPNQTWATNAYLVPFMNFAMVTAEEDALKIRDLGALTDVVEVPDVPAGTTDLSAYMNEGGLLELLTNVISIKERAITAPRDESSWRLMNPGFDVPTINAQSFNFVYAMNNGLIKLPGATQILDFRVFGKFRPTAITTEDTPIIQSLNGYLAAGAAAWAASSRGNDKLFERYETQAQRLLASYLNNQIQEIQAIRTRMRAYSGRPFETV